MATPHVTRTAASALAEALVAPLLDDARALERSGAASRAAIDLGMRLGAGHPRGPFEILEGTRPVAEPLAENAADPPTVVGVVGTGVMAAGIAEATARGGARAIVVGRTTGAATSTIARVRARADRAVERGKLTPEERDGVSGRLATADDLAGLAGTGLVIEAVVERLEDKRALMASLERSVDSRVPIATNTSSLTVSAIAGGARHPERFMALHFFNPAPAMQLVEVVAGAATDPALVPFGKAWATSIGKTPITCRDECGFVVNRLLVPYLNDAARSITDAGVDIVVADEVVKNELGHPMGPFELMDLIGLDVMVLALRAMHAAFADDRLLPAHALLALVDAGHLGRKTGRGFHRYA